MGNLFFTGDQHFGSHFIAGKRNFKTVYEHDSALIANWNAVVESRSDLVFILGDLAQGKRGRILEILESLNGRKALIRGNHDKAIKGKEIMKHFEFDRDLYSRRVDDVLVVMGHYPFETWNQMYYGSIHCHGHSHGALPRKRNRFDVGVDNNDFRPVTFDQIRARIISDPVYGAATLYQSQRDELREKLKNIGDQLMGRK